MTEKMFLMAFVAGLLLSVLVLIVGIWVRPRKGTPGWLMAVSTIFFLVGVGGMAWIAITGPGMPIRSIPEHVIFVLTFFSLTVAVTLFAAGFLWDRIRRCTPPVRN